MQRVRCRKDHRLHTWTGKSGAKLGIARETIVGGELLARGIGLGGADDLDVVLAFWRAAVIFLPHQPRPIIAALTERSAAMGAYTVTRIFMWLTDLSSSASKPFATTSSDLICAVTILSIGNMPASTMRMMRGQLCTG